MSNPIKISPEEMSEIQSLQMKISQKVFEFGNLSIEKMEIDQLVSEFLEKDKKLREDWEGLKKVQEDFVDKLIKKYGEGELDIKEGTFAPTSKQ